MTNWVRQSTYYKTALKKLSNYPPQILSFTTALKMNYDTTQTYVHACALINSAQLNCKPGGAHYVLALKLWIAARLHTCSPIEWQQSVTQAAFM